MDVKRIVSVAILAACCLLACVEGPMGPAGERGPQGDQGERGEQGERGLRGFDGADGRDGRDGISSFTLIEEYLDDDEWDGEFNSYYLRDPRIQPETVAGVYVKRFYTNTGDAYYMSVLDWLLVEDPSDPVIVQVLSGRVRFYDPDQLLQNEIVAVAITLP